MVLLTLVALRGLYVERWGCPSGKDRFTADEVVAAFAERGTTLTPTSAPWRNLNRDRVFRYGTDGATLLAVVCTGTCLFPDLGRVTIEQPPQRVRASWGIGNVDLIIFSAARGSTRELRDRVSDGIDEFAPTPQPGDRCYVG